MEGNARTWFTPKQKAELWERWKNGQCVADIARALGRRNKSGVYRVLAVNGGIAPAPRRRAPVALAAGIADCCARAAGGHASTALPNSLMNSRRLMASPRRSIFTP
jgi:hypothetical protein